MLLYYYAIVHSLERGAMIPKPRLMIGICREAEQAAHGYGWDRPPLLGVSFASPDGMTTGPFPVQPYEIATEGDNLRGLAAVARAVSQVTGGQLFNDTALTGPALTGIWYMTELWWAPNDTVIPRGLAIADTPAAKEARLMVLLDCGGRLYTAYRVRDESPAVGQGMLAEGDEEDVATIVDSLRQMMLAMGRMLPPNAVDLAAVAKVRADA